MERKVTWNDIQNGNPREIMNKYNLGERQMEQAVRKHLDGASRKEMKDVYNKFYTENNRRQR